MKNNFPELKTYIADSINLYDLDWVDIDYLNSLASFSVVAEVYLPVIFIAAAGIEFMNYRMDCPGCEVREEYFQEFYDWMINKEKELG